MRHWPFIFIALLAVLAFGCASEPKPIIKISGFGINGVSNGYDAYGRLATVGSGGCSAVYGYVPNSDLLQTTTCYSNLTPILTSTRTARSFQVPFV